jgi:AcrR family transcriptional regulator
MTNTDRVGRQRPGGRAARVRTDVLRAATDILGEVGYDGLSMEAVAERAGVHKTTVYRRWPTKAELVLDTATEQSAEAVPIPDTGTFLGDLQAFARSVAANMTSGSGARRSTSIVIAAASSDHLTESMHQFWAHRFALASVIVERAVERGDVPADTDPSLIIEALIGPLWVRLLLTGEPVTDDLADRIAALVDAGARP